MSIGDHIRLKHTYHRQGLVYHCGMEGTLRARDRLWGTFLPLDEGPEIIVPLESLEAV